MPNILIKLLPLRFNTIVHFIVAENLLDMTGAKSLAEKVMKLIDELGYELYTTEESLYAHIKVPDLKKAVLTVMDILNELHLEK